MSKIIKVSCKGSEMVDPHTLQHFQGNLKTLTEKQAEKIKTSILKYGFSFPAFVWKSPKGSKLIDGHQRVHVLKLMLQDGYALEGGKVPIAIVDAQNEKEAKEKVLLAASRYGKINRKGFDDFLSNSEISKEEMMFMIDMPEIAELNKADMEIKKEKEEKKDICCPKCGAAI